MEPFFGIYAHKSSDKVVEHYTDDSNVINKHQSKNIQASNVTRAEMTKAKGLTRLQELKDREELNKLVEKEPGFTSPFDQPEGYRRIPHTESEASNIIKTLIQKMNQIANRNYKALDIQSFKKDVKEAKNGRHIRRYTGNMFVLEKIKGRVNDFTKDISFVVETSMKVSPAKSVPTFIVRYLEVLGTNINNLKELDGLDPFDLSFKINNSLHLQEPWNTTSDKVLFRDEEIAVEQKRYNELIKSPEDDYKCFGGSNLDAETMEDCQKAFGMWDKPVHNNNECPYYRKNKNYRNNRGGVHGGYCELPMGMKRVGYRYSSANPDNKALCHNCKIGKNSKPGSIGHCCEDQKKRALYPLLNSPDYAFDGDVLERGHAREELRSKGLRWRNQPSRIDEKTSEGIAKTIHSGIVNHEARMLNKIQKQPVHGKFVY